jgi:hypothetical protein
MELFKTLRTNSDWNSERRLCQKLYQWVIKLRKPTDERNMLMPSTKVTGRMWIVKTSACNSGNPFYASLGKQTAT